MKTASLGLLEVPVVVRVNGVCLISKTPCRHPAFFPRWSKLHSKQGNDGEPSPASFSYERPPSRAAARDAAQSISSADSADSFCGGAAVVGGSGAE